MFSTALQLSGPLQDTPRKHFLTILLLCIGDLDHRCPVILQVRRHRTHRLNAPGACIRALLAAAAEAQLAGESLGEQACKGVRSAVPQVLLVFPPVRRAVLGCCDWFIAVVGLVVGASGSVLVRVSGGSDLHGAVSSRVGGGRRLAARLIRQRMGRQRRHVPAPKQERSLS